MAEPDSDSPNLNRLRAAVLGANDGIVSVAGLVVGLAGADASHLVILKAGLAGLVAGALSMAAGEYVSVSSQRDSERASLERERAELEQFPEQELEELAAIYRRKGLSGKTADQVARELTEHDAFLAHAEAELAIDPHNLTDPWHAALASAGSFVVGAVIPLVAILLPSAAVRIPLTVLAVLAASAITGSLSARAGGAAMGRAALRVMLGAAVAMAITFAAGHAVGAVTG